MDDREKLKKLAEIDSSRDVFVTTTNVEDKLLALNLALDNCKMQLEMLPMHDPLEGQDPHQGSKEKIGQRIELLTSLKTPLEKKLSEMEKNRIVVTRLEPPEQFGLETKLSVEHLRLSVSIFNPGDSDQDDLISLWRKLKIYGEINGFSEMAFKNALSNVLQGEAFEVFYMNKEKDLSTILKIMEQAYLSYETMNSLDEKLQSLKRKNGESIALFMNKVSALLTKTQELRENPDEYKDILLNIKLKQNVSKETLAFITREVNKAYKNGNYLPYENLFALAREKEEHMPDFIAHVNQLSIPRTDDFQTDEMYHDEQQVAEEADSFDDESSNPSYSDGTDEEDELGYDPAFIANQTLCVPLPREKDCKFCTEDNSDVSEDQNQE